MYGLSNPSSALSAEAATEAVLGAGESARSMALAAFFFADLDMGWAVEAAMAIGRVVRWACCVGVCFVGGAPSTGYSRAEVKVV